MVAEARPRELARLRSMIEQRLNVAVIGGAGMGKTALVEELIAQVDAVVVRIPCSRADSGIPMSGVRGAIAALRTLGDADFVDALTRIAQSGVPPAEAAEAAIDVVLTTHLPRPVLAVFDGFDLLDADSQEVFGHMLRRMTNSRLRAVVTARRVREDGPLGGVPSIVLRPLDRQATIELASRMVEDAISEDAAATAAHASGGSPLVLGSILALMTDRQRRGEAPFPRPVRVSDAAARSALDTVADASPEVHELLRAVSLSPLTPLRLLHRRYAPHWEEVLELKARGVLEQHGPYLVLGDVLLGSALHWSMTAAQRSALRREIIAAGTEETTPVAEAVAGTAAPVAEAAAGPRSTPAPAGGGFRSTDEAIMRWHRSFTEFEADPAGPLLRDARLLVTAGFVDAGVTFAERALTLSTDRREQAAPLIRLASAMLMRGDAIFAERYVRFADGADDVRLQLEALAVTVQAEYFHRGRLPAGVRHLWGRHEAESAPVAVARLQLILALSHAERYELAEAEGLVQDAGALLEHALARGVPHTEHVVPLHHAAQVMLDGYRGRGDRALEAYQRLVGPRTDEMTAFTALTTARALTMTEHHHPAREVFELLERRLDDTHLWYPVIPLLRADLEIRAGNLHLVSGLIDTATRRKRPGLPFREDQHLRFECRRLLDEGRDREAEAVGQELVRRASATGDRGALAHLTALQGAHLLVRGRAADAVRHLQRCDELAPGDIDPAVIGHEPDLIEALVRVGRREHAVLVLQRFRSRLTRFPSRWGELAAQRCEAWLATGEESLEQFRRILRGWRAEDSDLERARTLAAFSDRLQELGSTAEAADVRGQARTHALRAGDRAQERALAVAQEAAAPVVRPAHPVLAQLNAEELAVIDLVREGLRNREIADRIFVSLRTVEIRLTGIYRRFGVRSRTELVAKLNDTAEVVAG